MPDLFRRRGAVSTSLAVVPGLARVAGGAYLNALGWGARTALATSTRVARASTDAGEAAELVRELLRAAEVVRETAVAVANGVPVATAVAQAGESFAETAHRPVVSEEIRSRSLRERGADLLERSRDVSATEEGHPAFGRILGELAPDEARILLLLLRGGPQPSVDIRSGGPIGMVNSQLIAPGLSMIGMRAGVRRGDQVPAYLNNLFRLGLVWFSKEPLRNAEEYQVVEAQPDVLAALHAVKFTKVVRRSIHLTPFGEDFCRACLVDESTAEGGDFPEHEAPETD
ncbi:Abi-alpha family protein [Nocardioides sp.]|uniref:Abi-alpha family protein n=1 Tax=Nocardioides sp. TaxID=35761 RepID=UPI0026291FFE|nr:Abi-alpha family protein [Nocardioides sp.]